MNDKTERERESRRIINRVGAESEASMVRRASDHMAGRDAEDKDWAELWGTRIGRWLSLALLVYLVWWLIRFAATGG